MVDVYNLGVVLTLLGLDLIQIADNQFVLGAILGLSQTDIRASSCFLGPNPKNKFVCIIPNFVGGRWEMLWNY